jgi:hemerythrin-like domain-containing protein
VFTANLRNDHVVIKRLRDIAARYSELLYQGVNIDINDLKELIITIEEFIDKCHHSKEECSFFPTFANNKELESEIKALIIEHEFGRRVINMIDRYISEWFNDREPIARLLNAYVTFLDMHMNREEKFFDLIDSSYKPDKIANLERFNMLKEQMDIIKARIDKLREY